MNHSSPESPEEIARQGTLDSLDDRVEAVQQNLLKIHAKTDQPAKSIGLLLVSLVLFVALGAWFWSFELVLYLLPILLFHELGHYVAMRYFRYRNVKMFFVPLLGAAVSGQHFNVPGWKKVVVSLAGPLPGILIAIPMCIASLTLESEFWRNAALMVLLVNVFNLLPLLPLDGGWVAHALFFCRQPWLEATFRVVTAICMILAGLIWEIVFLTIFGALMLLAAPAAFKISQVAARLKSQGGSALSADRSTIPVGVVRNIVRELPASGPAAEPKILAAKTIRIFEVLNARPPGFVTTLGLTLLYLSGWVITGLVLLSLYFVPQWQQDWQQPPTFSVAQDSVSVFGEQSVSDVADRYLVVGKFSDSAAVSQTAAGLANFSNDDFAYATAGQAVLVSIDSETASEPVAQTMLDEFERKSDRTDWYQSVDAFYFKLGFVAPTETAAESIYHDINDMFLFGNDLNSFSPWSPLHQLTIQQRRARETRRILDVPFDAAADPELISLGGGGIGADRSDDAFDAYDEAYQLRYEAAVEEMSRDETGRYDQAVIQHWLKRPGTGDESQLNERQWRAELSRLLGGLPLSAEPSMGPANESVHQDESQLLKPFRFHATSGQLTRQGREVRILFIHFRHPIEGLPAMLRWLQAEGCSQIKFQTIDGRLNEPLR